MSLENIKRAIARQSEYDKQKQNEIIDYCFEHFAQVGNSLFMIKGGQLKTISSKQAFKTLAKILIEEETGSFFYKSTKKTKDENEEKAKYLPKINLDTLYDVLTTINSYDILKYSNNPFLPEQKIEIVNDTIHIIQNQIHVSDVSMGGITEDERREIIEDYRDHFPQLDDFIQLCIDMRFAHDRKASFLHLHVVSDWGKSFLAGILKSIDVGFEIDYHHLMEKRASDISPAQVRNSFVLFLDEFNKFSAEMKKLSHSFTFAPKFGMAETVDLYLKVLMSAEESPSFTGGVDSQIVNRVMVMKPNTKQKLTEREIYLKHGNQKYKRVLENYFSMRFKKLISEYLAMGELEASKTADKRVRQTYAKYKLQAEDLGESIRDLLNNAIESICTKDSEDVPKILRDKIIKLDENEYFIKTPKKTLETILKMEATEEEYKKMRYKLNLEDNLNVIGDFTKNPKRINGKNERGIYIYIPKFGVTQKSVKTEVLDKNGNVIDTKIVIKEEKEEIIPF